MQGQFYDATTPLGNELFYSKSVLLRQSKEKLDPRLSYSQPCALGHLTFSQHLQRYINGTADAPTLG